jgi:serine/threonine protein phosphatase PrpC
MIVFDRESGEDPLQTTVNGGAVVACSSRAPDKDSDNEDSVAVFPYGGDAVVLVVADGAGGMPAGERASQTAVESLGDSLRRALADNTSLRTAVLNGIDAANGAVQALANGSATTMTVVTIEGTTARMYQIGDSEAVIAGQRGRIKAQSMAHSPTGFAVEAGFLDERAALHHEERHLVSNLLGTPDMRIDVGATVDLAPRDTVLVASDGLTDNLHMTEIIELMRKGPLTKARDALASLATRRMTVESQHQPSKPDDLSIILFRRNC